jgi:hypothetical protein
VAASKPRLANTPREISMSWLRRFARGRRGFFFAAKVDDGISRL